MATLQLENWALPRLQQLLPLDDESLRQVLQYALTLPKDAAADHLKNLLGDGSSSLEFIASFNQRRGPSAPSSATTATTSSSSSSQQQQQHQQQPPPTNHDRQSASTRGGRGGGGGGGKKQKRNIHSLPARQIDGQGDVSGAYRKHDQDEYMSAKKTPASHRERIADNLALRETRPPQDGRPMPLITDEPSSNRKTVAPRAPPSAAGALIEDALLPKSSKASAQSSRNASPAPNKAKVSIAGGTPMHGASTALSDLDSAIRSLEMQTNPTLSSPSEVDERRRKCSCMATRHPLLDIAPNCLQCGNIICVKQGLGPCTSCGAPLMSADDINKVLRVLKDERGEEKTRINNAAHKRADVSLGKARALTGRDFLAQASSSNRPSPLSSAGPSSPAMSEDEEISSASAQAKAHRDKLLGFQANNARRTRIHDDAADYEIPTAGTNMWASPAERAQQLKRQQRVLREMQWNARPEHEKRRVVASIDLKGGRIVKRMAAVEKPDFSADEDLDEADDEDAANPYGAVLPQSLSSVEGGAANGTGAFGRNPLAKGLIRPVARKEAGASSSAEDGSERRREKTWRRVQMDDGDDDNEALILDGGVYGGRTVEG